MDEESLATINLLINVLQTQASAVAESAKAVAESAKCLNQLAMSLDIFRPLTTIKTLPTTIFGTTTEADKGQEITDHLTSSTYPYLLLDPQNGNPPAFIRKTNFPPIDQIDASNHVLYTHDYQNPENSKLTLNFDDSLIPENGDYELQVHSSFMGPNRLEKVIFFTYNRAL